jgi:excisionase family DNA binding protein
MTSRRKHLKEMLDEPGRYLSIEQASAYTTFTQQSLYRRVSDNTIPHIKVGRRVLFDKVDLDAWMESQKSPPPPPTKEEETTTRP